MKVSVFTCTPAFENDLMDALRIFTGSVEVLSGQEGGDLTLRHEEEQMGDIRVCRVTLSGLYAGSAVRREQVQADPLTDKRMHKRQAKRCVYDVMKAATGFAPPWGSLTGIRPTRLIYMAMESGKTLQEARQEMTEVFDVQPEKTDLLCQVVKTQQTLPWQQPSEIDLYVGIPFCVSRCAYCSFLSGEVGRGTQLAPYTDALVREIQAVCAMVSRYGLRPRAFYMGGGTPTALPAPLLRQVLDAAAPLLSRCREITVEAGRPDTIDREKLAVIRDAGATRISVNPQTMHDDTLARIGRRHTRLQTEEAYALAREMGFHDVNMDLIAGLPGEDAAIFARTLAWLHDLAPESMTVHTLCIKRASLLHLWETALPPGCMVADMVRLGRQEAASRGMVPYYLYRQKYMAGNLENVGYALPGCESLYNIGMMEETANVLALGAGGISKRVNTATGHIRRAPNVSDIGQYIDRVDEMIARKEALLCAGCSSPLSPTTGK